MENTNTTNTEDTNTAKVEPRLRHTYIVIVASYGNAYFHQCNSPTKAWGWAFGFHKPTDMTFYLWDESCGMYMAQTIQSIKTLVENDINENFTKFLNITK